MDELLSTHSLPIDELLASHSLPMDELLENHSLGKKQPSSGRGRRRRRGGGPTLHCEACGATYASRYKGKHPRCVSCRDLRESSPGELAEISELQPRVVLDKVEGSLLAPLPSALLGVIISFVVDVFGEDGPYNSGSEDGGRSSNNKTASRDEAKNEDGDDDNEPRRLRQRPPFSWAAFGPAKLRKHAKVVVALRLVCSSFKRQVAEGRVLRLSLNADSLLKQHEQAEMRWRRRQCSLADAVIGQVKTAFSLQVRAVRRAFNLEARRLVTTAGKQTSAPALHTLPAALLPSPPSPSLPPPPPPPPAVFGLLVGVAVLRVTSPTASATANPSFSAMTTHQSRHYCPPSDDDEDDSEYDYEEEEEEEGAEGEGERRTHKHKRPVKLSVGSALLLRCCSSVWRNVRVLDLSHLDLDAQVVARHIPQGCPVLEALDVSYCENIDDASVESLSLGPCRHSLRAINLTACKYEDIGDVAVQSLCANCPRLESLRIGYSGVLSDKAFQCLVLPLRTTDNTSNGNRNLSNAGGRGGGGGGDTKRLSSSSLLLPSSRGPRDSQGSSTSRGNSSCGGGGGGSGSMLVELSCPYCEKIGDEALFLLASSSGLSSPPSSSSGDQENGRKKFEPSSSSSSSSPPPSNVEESRSNVSPAQRRNRRRGCRIRSLNVANCPRVTAKGVRALLEASGPNMTALDLSGCDGVHAGELLLGGVADGVGVDLGGGGEGGGETGGGSTGESEWNRGGGVGSGVGVVCGALQHCPHLRCLLLTDCYTLNDASLFGLVANSRAAQSLTELDVSFKLVPSPVVSSRALETALPQLTSLTSLNVSYLENVTDAVVGAIAVACSKLRVLHLASCVKLTDASLVALANHLGHSLKVLNLHCDDLCTDHGLIKLCEKCKKLTDLDAAFLRFLTDDTVDAIIHHAKALERLTLHGCLKITKRARARVQEVWDEQAAARRGEVGTRF